MGVKGECSHFVKRCGRFFECTIEESENEEMVKVFPHDDEDGIGLESPKSEVKHGPYLDQT